MDDYSELAEDFLSYNEADYIAYQAQVEMFEECLNYNEGDDIAHQAEVEMFEECLNYNEADDIAHQAEVEMFEECLNYNEADDIAHQAEVELLEEGLNYQDAENEILNQGQLAGYRRDNGAGNQRETITEVIKTVDPEDAILIVAENFHVLKSKVPDAENRHLWGLAKDCLKKGDNAAQYAEDLINTGDYPVEQVYGEFLETERDEDFKAAMKYCSLRSILPDADSAYVWGVAKDHADSEMLFNQFVLHLQNTGDYPKSNSSELSPMMRIEMKKQELTKNAQDILNNIDSLYIEQQLNDEAALGYNEEGVSKLILDCMNNERVCPSKSDEYYRRTIEEAKKQYTNEFNVEKFLHRFREPVVYFEKRQNPAGPKYRADVLKYLRVVAPHLTSAQVVQFQKTQKYLLPCHRSLFGHKVPMSTINYQLTNECGRFINELMYIRFYEEILPTAAIYVSLTDGQNLTSGSFRDDLDTVACELCEEQVPLRAVLTCSEAHMFCVECVRGWVNERFENGHTYVTCLQSCEGTITDDNLSKVLPAGALEKLIIRRQNQDIRAAQVEGLVSCLWCDFSYIPRNEDQDLVCLNPECGERWCGKCRELAHHPNPCEDTPEEVIKRVYIEERMSQAAVRLCPRCKAYTEKVEGCDYVTCRCGVGFCYNCGKVTNHHHCNEARAIFDVNAEGQRAKAEANSMYPNVRLNHDPMRLS